MKKRDIFIAAAVAGVAAIAGKSANAAVLGPVLAVVSHQVRDFAAWRAFFDQAAPFREKSKVLQSDVFQDPRDKNKITVIQHYATLADAEAFLSQPQWRENMLKAGVVGGPDVTLLVAV